MIQGWCQPHWQVSTYPNKLEGGFLKLAGTSVLVVEGAPKNGYLWVLVLQWEVQLPPASRKDAANGSNPDSFQMAASVGTRECENLYAPHKSRVYFLQLHSLLCANPAGHQSQMF